MAVSDRIADKNAEQDVTLLKYILKRGGASWGNFTDSFAARSHDYILERLHSLTMRGYVTHSIPCDGYSDRSQTWKVTPKGERHA